MGRAVVAATLLVACSLTAFAQARSTIHITVTLADAAGKTTPVGRYALLISEEPPTAPPRRILTTLAGTVDVTLRPGRYAIESDEPVAFGGKSYEWAQRIDIVEGRDATLELTIHNARVDTLTGTGTSATPSDADPSVLAARWKDSVVSLWTPTQHASAFLVDARGLLVTNQRVIGTASSAEAQLTPDLKVRATVLATDPTRDVAILWINPSAVAALRPLPLGCGETRPSVANGQDLYSIAADMTGRTDLSPGAVTGVGPRLLLSDLTLSRASAGGPVFTSGKLIGFTTVEDRDPDSRSDARVVRIDQACELMASAETKMAVAMPPDATHLPLDPPPVAIGRLEEATKTRAGNLSPYTMSTTSFDVAFITPVHVYGSRQQVRSRVMDFGSWEEYVTEYPRVLLVRVTPKMVEGLMARLARGAVMTQGVMLPPMKRAKSAFLRMRAFCGDAEVTPIHPFVVEHRISDTEATYEGLYAFDPAAFGLSCGTVRLTVYAEDKPNTGDTRSVDANVLQQIARDFALF